MAQRNSKYMDVSIFHTHFFNFTRIFPVNFFFFSFRKFHVHFLHFTLIASRNMDFLVLFFRHLGGFFLFLALTVVSLVEIPEVRQLISGFSWYGLPRAFSSFQLFSFFSFFLILYYLWCE